MFPFAEIWLDDQLAYPSLRVGHAFRDSPNIDSLASGYAGKRA